MSSQMRYGAINKVLQFTSLLKLKNRDAISIVSKEMLIIPNSTS